MDVDCLIKGNCHLARILIQGCQYHGGRRGIQHLYRPDCGIQHAAARGGAVQNRVRASQRGVNGSGVAGNSGAVGRFSSCVLILGALRDLYAIIANQSQIVWVVQYVRINIGAAGKRRADICRTPLMRACPYGIGGRKAAPQAVQNNMQRAKLRLRNVIIEHNARMAALIVECSRGVLCAVHNKCIVRSRRVVCYAAEALGRPPALRALAVVSCSYSRAPELLIRSQCNNQNIPVRRISYGVS